MSKEGQNEPEAVPGGASRGQGLMEESLVTAPPPPKLGPLPNASSWGLPFLSGGGSGPLPPWTGLAGAAAEFTAQSLAEKKAFSGEPSLQGSREEGGRGGTAD